jgi:hypothetical protein
MMVASSTNPQIKAFPDSLFRSVGLTDPTTCSAEQTRRRARKLSASVLANHREFPFLYFTAGSTEALNWLLRQPFSTDPADFRYVRALPDFREDRQSLQYLSNPFSGTGMIIEVPNDELVLDAAYAFCTHDFTFTAPRGTMAVTFSLSKSHNLADARVGWFLSRKPVPSVHVLQYEYEYMSSVTHSAIALADSFAPNELYLRHGARLRDEMSMSGYTVGDVPLFGFKDGKRVPYYLCN